MDADGVEGLLYAVVMGIPAPGIAPLQVDAADPAIRSFNGQPVAGTTQ